MAPPLAPEKWKKYPVEMYIYRLLLCGDFTQRSRPKEFFVNTTLVLAASYSKHVRYIATPSNPLAPLYCNNGLTSSLVSRSFRGYEYSEAVLFSGVVSVLARREDDGGLGDELYIPTHRLRPARALGTILIGGPGEGPC